jgi:hypothetical protein
MFAALWVPISAMLFRRAVLTLWHALLFLGLRFFPLFFFLLGGRPPLLFIARMSTGTMNRLQRVGCVRPSSIGQIGVTE